ncbi:nuclear inhibitor of protein phosphatase 1 [Protopterus annectens]|uniref:nuclear inhibitor of protein phosphatase 1 n=1 Tax=Protopterus annectens TaxID=7888 RepID=UPI001CF998F2|nr:nuclear inhibitor of protein phosphatase 1 [Protopterus annectens]
MACNASALRNLFECPSWAGKPPPGLHLDVIKGDKLVEKLIIDEKKYYLFGRNPDVCDFTIDHQSCSRVHAALVYHKHLKRVFLIDLNSTHGTYLGRIRLEAHKPQQIPIDSTVSFGASTRLYTLREKPPTVPSAVKGEEKTGEDEELKGLLGLPEEETELDNLTEFNTAHNKRISTLTIEEGNLDIQRPKRKRRNSKVSFSEEDEIINPGIEQISYLDILLINDRINGKYKSLIFRKQTYSNSLLHFSSNHPFHQKKAVIKGQLVRAARMVSDGHDYEKECNRLMNMFLIRGYPFKLVSDIIAEVTAKRNEGLYLPLLSHNYILESNGELILDNNPNKIENKKEETNNNYRISFLHTYSLDFKEIKEILFKNWDVLKNDRFLMNLLGEVPRITYRRDDNLKTILQRSKIKNHTNREYGMFKCGFCAQCKFIKKKRTEGQGGQSLEDSAGKRLQNAAFNSGLYSGLPPSSSESGPQPLSPHGTAIVGGLPIPFPNLAPDVDLAPAVVQTAVTINPTPSQVPFNTETVNEPKKKKYAKEAWPGKKPTPSLLI